MAVSHVQQPKPIAAKATPTGGSWPNLACPERGRDGAHPLHTAPPEYRNQNGEPLLKIRYHIPLHNGRLPEQGRGPNLGPRQMMGLAPSRPAGRKTEPPSTASWDVPESHLQTPGVSWKFHFHGPRAGLTRAMRA